MHGHTTRPDPFVCGGNPVRPVSSGAHLGLPRHENFDQARTGLACDFNKSQFFLGFFQIFLHGLGLLHETGELTFVKHICLSVGKGFDGTGNDFRVKFCDQLLHHWIVENFLFNVG